MVDWDYSRKLFADIRKFPEFCQKYLLIQPKGGSGLVPFKLNKVQQWYFEKYLAPDWESGRPVRHCVLKARQFGFSTFFEAFTLWTTLGHVAWSSIVVADVDDRAKNIFRMIRRFDRNLPMDGKVLPIFPKASDATGKIEYLLPPATHKPYKWRAREEEIVELDSRIDVFHAGERDKLGRSGTYHCVHGSEVAFWPDLPGALGSLLPAVPDKPQTTVFLETTANGMNQFHRFWMDLRMSGLQTKTEYWRRIFVPWYWSDEYEMDARARFEITDEEEKLLLERIQSDKDIHEFDNIDDRRIKRKVLWRRFTVHEKFLGDEDKFKQEYPSTPSEAFLHSGLSVYTKAALARLDAGVKDPVWRGDVLTEWLKNKKGPGAKFSVRWQEANDGCLNVYEWPQPLHEYVLFADLAEGKATRSSDKSHYGDYTCIQCLKISDYPPVKQVAVWHGNCDPDHAGDLLVALARKYNQALVCWEVNGPGASLALQIIDRHRYSNVWMREDFESATRSYTKKPGWRTTRKTKPLMVAVSQRFVREADVEVPDAGTVTEMKSFSVLGQNLYGAAEGNDDRVMALCGALAISESIVATVTARVHKYLERRKQEEQDANYLESSLEMEEDQWHPILGSEW